MTFAHHPAKHHGPIPAREAPSRDTGRRESRTGRVRGAVPTEGNPDAYLPDLVGVLSSLSVDLGEEGRRAEGLAVVEEAVAAALRAAGYGAFVSGVDAAPTPTP
ncbi:hypothetical protein [Kitasatospora sp. NPDC015120]|uniref:hypothetical protein n=1 Tax=Kitasatospora sp. NPDC015120 TaxID=3364023 RepID=UPI0036F4A3DE